MMTNAEILQSYRNAVNAAKQVEILAQLNACKTEQIAAILEAGGETVSERFKMAKRRGLERRWTPEKLAEMNRLVEIGWDKAEIAEHFAISQKTLKCLASKYRIPLKIATRSASSAYRKWTDDKLAEMAALAAEKTVRELAAIYGLKQGAMRQLLHRYGITAAPARKRAATNRA